MWIALVPHLKAVGNILFYGRDIRGSAVQAKQKQLVGYALWYFCRVILSIAERHFN